MNEALARLDVVAGGRVESMALASPPAAPSEGEAHIVAAAATGEWSGHDGDVATFLNGGWDFIAPWSGWRLWVNSIAAYTVHDGVGWYIAAQPVSAGGALTAMRLAEIEHTVAAGATTTTTAFIPDKAIFLGVTARVTAEITGAASWSLGITGSPDRYGSGFGIGLNAFAHGVTGSPVAYFGASSLLMAASGGDFTGGSVRVAAHYFDLSPPRPI